LLFKTKFLFSKPAPEHQMSGRELMVLVLEAALELAALENNCFVWTFWGNTKAVEKDIHLLMKELTSIAPTALLRLKLFFGPTSSFQDLSISSGWGNEFLKLAEYHDYASERLGFL
jgi:hypothetical protein